MTTILLDAAIGTPIGAVAGVIVFFFFAIIAAISFFLLKKTLKMAIRVGVLIALLVVGAIGAVAFFGLGLWSDSGPRPRPGPPINRPSPNR